MTTISERQRACFYLYKKCETSVNTKRKTLFKKQDSLRYVFIYKSIDTLGYTIFHEILEYRKYETWHYVSF